MDILEKKRKEKIFPSQEKFFSLFFSKMPIEKKYIFSQRQGLGEVYNKKNH